MHEDDAHNTLVLLDSKYKFPMFNIDVEGWGGGGVARRDCKSRQPLIHACSWCKNLP